MSQSFRKATDELFSVISHEELAKALGCSVATIRQARLAEGAKALSPNQIKAVLLHLASTRNPERNRVAFLLSVKAGLRAKEVASVTWAMVTTSEGHIACASSDHLRQMRA